MRSAGRESRMEFAAERAWCVGLTRERRQMDSCQLIDTARQMQAERAAESTAQSSSRVEETPRLGLLNAGVNNLG